MIRRVLPLAVAALIFPVCAHAQGAAAQPPAAQGQQPPAPQGQQPPAPQGQQPPAPGQQPPAPGQPPATPGQPPAPGQPPVTPGQAPAAAAPAVGDRTFASDAGVIFNPIKPEKVADFEAIVTKLREALTKNPDPIRKQQAAGWKVYKAAEPFQGGVLYLFVMDPTVKGADYSVSRILAEMFPSEVQGLYEKFRDSFSSPPSVLNLAVLANLGPAAPAK